MANDSSRTIGVIHVVWTLFVVSYPFVVTQKSWWDMVYMYYYLALYMSWTLLNGECLISYVDKKLSSTDYAAGQDATSLNDFDMVFGKGSYTYIFPVLMLGMAAGNLIVFGRNKALVPFGWTAAMVAYLIVYLLMLRTKWPITKAVSEGFKLFLAAMATVYTTRVLH